MEKNNVEKSLLRSKEKDHDGKHASWTQRVWPEKSDVSGTDVTRIFPDYRLSIVQEPPPPLAEIPSPWIDPRYFIVDDVFFFASDRNETKIKSSILPTRHGNFFFLFFSVHFIQSFFVHDGISITQTDVRSDLYRDSSPGWNLAQIARFHKNHSLTYVSIVH